MARSSVFARCRRLFAIAGLGALLAVPLPAPASAQGIFDVLFGGFKRAMTPRAHSNANSSADPRFSDNHSGGGPSSGYCVRLCDGRYFPVSGRGRMGAAEMCRAFCPSTPTQIFSGGNIATAYGNGKRYTDLPNAFVYREKLVPDCTCDGKSPTGLVRFEEAEDPTLRTGDIVATNKGLMAYRNDGRQAELMPLTSNLGLPPKLREQLSATRVAPGRAAEDRPEESDGEPLTGRNAEQRAQASR